MHVIIPMSGVGKRFLDAGYATPKPLLLVEEKPIIQHVVDLFPGESKFTFICNDQHLAETDMAAQLSRIAPQGTIVSVPVHDRKGPVDAVLQARHFIDDDEPCIVSYCDYGTQWDYAAFRQHVAATHVDGSIACYRGFHPHMLGTDQYAFVRERNGRVLDIQEKKPFTDNRMDEYASNGTYYFRTGDILKRYFQRLVDLGRSLKGEFYVSMVYPLMLQDGLEVSVFPIQKMLQWGTPADLEEYRMWSDYFRKRDPHFLAQDVDDADTTLLLPMAGAGTRFYHQGYATPKPLLDVEGEPMVVQAVRCLPATSRKVFVCQEGHLKQYPIEAQLRQLDAAASIVSIDHVTEGQACTCAIGLEASGVDMEKPLLISACDNGVYYDVLAYRRLVADADVDMIVWTFSNHPSSRRYPHFYAWVDADADGWIRRVSVKRPFTDCPNEHAIIGTMLFKRRRFFEEGLRLLYASDLRTNGEFYVDNMIEPLLRSGLRAKIFPVMNYLCWGTPNDYQTYLYWHEYFTSAHDGECRP